MVKEGGACPSCASMNTVYSDVREQTICRDCGMIFEPFDTSVGFSMSDTETVTLAATEIPTKKKRTPQRKVSAPTRAKKAVRKPAARKKTERKAKKPAKKAVKKTRKNTARKTTKKTPKKKTTKKTAKKTVKKTAKKSKRR